MNLSEEIKEKYCSQYANSQNPIDNCVGCPYWKFTGTLKRCQAPEDTGRKIFVINYNDLHNSLQNNTGKVLDMLNEIKFDCDTEWKNIRVHLKEGIDALFTFHSKENGYLRIMFTEMEDHNV